MIFFHKLFFFIRLGRTVFILALKMSSDWRHSFAGGVPASSATYVRLADGNFVGQGRLEVYFNGEWGTVCDDYWSITNSDVVCQELGFESAIDFYINVGDVGVVPVRF